MVGVNTAILSPSGGSVGIGFAIPSDTVRTIVAELEKDGHVTRGYLGVQAQAITGPMRAALRLLGKGGALVASVEADSPASKAGLQPGDVIEQVNGKAITDPRQLAVDVAAVQPGDQAKITLVRDGDSKDLQVTVATLPSSGDKTAAAEQQKGGNIGLALAPLTPDTRSQLNLPDQVHGAVIAEVRPGSPADQAGLQQGDVVVGVGEKSVSSPSEAVSAIRQATAGGKTAALRIVRDGTAAFVAVSTSGNSDQG